MALLRFDHFAELDPWSNQVWNPWGRGHLGTMPFDAYRRGDDVVLHFDLPGIDPETVEVTLEKRLLTVTAERRDPRQEGDEVYVTQRPVGRFTRRVMLGEDLHAGDVHADYHDGVLTVVLPVAEPARPRKIEVRTSAAPVIDTASAEDGGEPAPGKAA